MVLGAILCLFGHSYLKEKKKKKIAVVLSPLQFSILFVVVPW
jgi:hypothetical protein